MLTYLQRRQMDCVSHAPHSDVWGAKENKIPLQQDLQVLYHRVIVGRIVRVNGYNLLVVNIGVWNQKQYKDLRDPWDHRQ